MSPREGVHIYKNLSILQLIHKAYKEEDDNAYMEYIHAIRKRANTQTLEIVRSMVYSKDHIKRDMAASILSQIAYPSKSFKGEAVYLLGRLLDDKHKDVITSAIYGFGHRRCTRFANKIASLGNTESLQIKEALSFTLGWYENQESIYTLIRLMQDENDDVRNWATFSLAQINESNTQTIRDALFHNLSDQVLEIRGEALLGLARRKDERVKDAILDDLQKPFYGSWIFDAIMEMPDKRYSTYFERYVGTLEKDDLNSFANDIKRTKSILEQYKGKI